MPTLAQLAEHGRTVQLVIAERLGLDPAEVTTLGWGVDAAGKHHVTWQSRRAVPADLLADCLTEAARRVNQEEAHP